MRVLAIALLLVQPVLALQQDPAALEATLKRGSEADRVAAIEATAGNSDAKVTSIVARALTDKSLPVGIAAAGALGQMEGTESLKALHRAAGSASLKKDVTRLAAVFRAIGRRGDPSSVTLLAAQPGQPISFPVIRARIYGLGNIRTNDSVAKLVSLTNLDAVTRTESAIFLEDLRTALCVLTGIDQGGSNSTWNAWWRDNKDSFKCATERPWVSQLHALRWEGFWGEPYTAEAPRPAVPQPRAGTTLEDTVTALNSSDPAVLLASVEFLGRSDDARALDALHKGAGYRALRDNPKLFAAVMKAIGRHGDPSSVAILKDKPFAVRSFDAFRARIYGLANVRTSEAIDALVSMAQLGSPVRGEAFVFMDDYRTALRAMTGVDQGISKIEWDAWWRKNKDTFEVPAERPWLPELLALRWEEFWGEPYGVGQPGTPGLPGMSAADAIRALAGSDSSARFDAVRVLGRASDQTSLSALHAAAGRKNVRDEPALMAAVLRAIGRRGDPSSVAVLGDKPLSVPTFDVIRARIYGLANIRTEESIDALISAMKLASPPPGEPFVFIDDLRTALAVLSGVDHGAWKGEWDRWWRSAKKTFEVSPTRPAIEPLLALRWQEFWGEPYGG